MQIISMFFNFVREIIFDHKDEYNFKSPKFNVKKVFLLVLLLISMFANFFLLSNFMHLGGKYLEVQIELTALKDSKNNQQTSSDSQKP